MCERFYDKIHVKIHDRIHGRNHNSMVFITVYMTVFTTIFMTVFMTVFMTAIMTLFMKLFMTVFIKLPFLFFGFDFHGFWSWVLNWDLASSLSICIYFYTQKWAEIIEIHYQSLTIKGCVRLSVRLSVTSFDHF